MQACLLALQAQISCRSNSALETLDLVHGRRHSPQLNGRRKLQGLCKEGWYSQLSSFPVQHVSHVRARGCMHCDTMVCTERLKVSPGNTPVGQAYRQGQRLLKVA